MEQIDAMDKVQIVRVNADQEAFLNKVGQIIMIVDGDQYFVSFPDGTSGTFGLEQLKKVS